MGPNGPKFTSGPVSLECMTKTLRNLATKYLAGILKTSKENSNDIDINFDDLERTFNSVFSSYLTFGPSYCQLMIQR